MINRYAVEHKHFPQFLFYNDDLLKSGFDDISDVLKKMLIAVWKFIFLDKPETDFKISSEKLNNDVELFIISMPEPVQMLDCRHIGIFIDRKTNSLRYFTSMYTTKN